jgi:galactonate dehydratase
MPDPSLNHRELFFGFASLRLLGASSVAASNLKIDGMEVFVVDVSPKGNWIFVRLKTNRHLTGLGEASHGSGFASRTHAADAERMKGALKEFFELVREQSPFELEEYRRRARTRAKSGGLMLATAFSALEQAQWDLVGKALGVPVHKLFGGQPRSEIPLYANINRATIERSPAAFAANAGEAMEQGFRAIKAAPFDGFPPMTAPRERITRAVDDGIACVAAMRRAIGPKVDLMIDCHSKFDVELSIEIARRLEPHDLAWYEEPVDPEQTEETKVIRSSIKQRMAGGELLFGVESFGPLCRGHGLDVIMPDVKHCGGILEGREIAALAQLENLDVSPHNPSGPVATAASVQWCAGMPNLTVLEYQWNEVPWRSELITPPERIDNGTVAVPAEPGFGIELNDRVVEAHSLKNR